MSLSSIRAGRSAVALSAGAKALARERLPTPQSKAVYARGPLAAIAARWDARAATWEKDLRNPRCHLNEDRAYARFLGHLRKIIGARRDFCARHGVIDAGCGTGLVLQEVVRSFAWGVGIDLSLEMIRTAKSKRLQRTRFMVGDCLRMAAFCPQAGAVVSRGVLLSHYGLRRGGALLRSARAALAPGGFALFDYLNAPGRRYHSHKAEDKHWLTTTEVRGLALRAGFRKVRILGSPERRVRVLIAE